jgi:hypothetical protein
MRLITRGYAFAVDICWSISAFCIATARLWWPSPKPSGRAWTSRSVPGWPVVVVTSFMSILLRGVS